MSEIERLALGLLDQQEVQLAYHLSVLLGDDKWDAGPLVEDILPVYWEKVGDRCQNVHPGNIYRPLNYIHVWSSQGNFKDNTRAYMNVISGHLEGCLLNLLIFPCEYEPSSGTFGHLVAQLKKKGILSAELADHLWKFNEFINIRAKHFGTYAPTRWLDERTFSVIETTYAIVIMRKLSKQLFALLKAKGVPIPQGWPEFKDHWLSWFPEFNERS